MHDNDPGSMEWERLRPVLDDAMDELSGRDREAVLLRFFSRQSFAEIARALCVSEDAARMRVDRAVGKMHRALARRGVTSSAVALGTVMAGNAVAAAPSQLAGAIAHAAIASGAGVTGPAAVLTFMGMTKVGAVVAVAALALGLGGAAYLRETRIAVELEAAAVARHHDAQADMLTRLQEQVAAMEQDTPALRRAGMSSRPASTAVAAVEPVSSHGATPPPADPQEVGVAFLGRHPQVKAALHEYAAASNWFKYAPFYRDCNLSEEQIRAFETLYGGTMGANLADGTPMALPFGDPPDPTTFAHRLRDAIGEAAMKRLAVYSNIAEARGVASDVAGSLYFTDAPLAPEQSDALVKILAKARGGLRPDSSTAYDWNVVMADAGKILSEPQLSALSARRARDHFTAALNRVVAARRTAVPAN